MSDSVWLRLPHPWDSPGKNSGVGCHFLLQCMKVKSESEVAQSCPTLCDPMDCSLPGSSVHGSFQARVLESGAIAFSSLNHQGSPNPPSYFLTLESVNFPEVFLISLACVSSILHWLWHSNYCLYITSQYLVISKFKKVFICLILVLIFLPSQNICSIVRLHIIHQFCIPWNM